MSVEATRRGFLRQLGFGVGVVALGGSAGLLMKPTVAEAAMPWHGYSQAQRNSMIIARGLQDAGKKVNGGIECKPWVQIVVPDASRSVVYVPRTINNGIGYSNDQRWEPSPDVVGWCKPIRNVVPGETLQMSLRTTTRQARTGGFWTPHTAIMVGVSSSGMQWVDSNFNEDLTVRSHFVLFSYFTDKVMAYSVYYFL